MQKAAVWEMPLAIGSAFADFSSISGAYFRLPLTHDLVYVTLHPDISNYHPQDAMQIAFPRHSVFAEFGGLLAAFVECSSSLSV